MMWVLKASLCFLPDDYDYVLVFVIFGGFLTKFKFLASLIILPHAKFQNFKKSLI